MKNEEIKANKPEGATHIDHTGLYWDLERWLVFIDGSWQKDETGFARIWTPIKQTPR